MIKRIIDFFQSKNNGDNRKGLSKKYSYVIVIGLSGILLLLLGNIFTNTDKNTEMNKTMPPKEEAKEQSAASNDSTLTSDVNELEKTYKEDLETMLSKVKGVTDVEVMINLDSTNVKVFEKNLITGKQITDEKDKNGGNREIEDYTEETEVVLVRQGDQEVPLQIQTKKPVVRGVFVVAKGVDHAEVKKWVVDSTSRVLDVPTHKISVMPKN